MCLNACKDMLDAGPVDPKDQCPLEHLNVHLKKVPRGPGVIY